jgi:hypothetical protein
MNLRSRLLIGKVPMYLGTYLWAEMNSEVQTFIASSTP